MTVRQLFDGLEQEDLDKELVVYVPLHEFMPGRRGWYTPLDITDFRRLAIQDTVLLNTAVPAKLIWNEVLAKLDREVQDDDA